GRSREGEWRRASKAGARSGLLVRVATPLFYQEFWDRVRHRGRLGLWNRICQLAPAPTPPAQARSRSASHAGGFLAPQRALRWQIALRSWANGRFAHRALHCRTGSPLVSIATTAFD